MKVVLFCGGAGMRLRGYSEDVPKPMVTVGARPVLWHVMKYYAHYGHTDFVLCLGYKANVIKNYFLEYEESVSNDFVFSRGGHQLEFMQRRLQNRLTNQKIEYKLWQRRHAPELSGQEFAQFAGNPKGC